MNFVLLQSTKVPTASKVLLGYVIVKYEQDFFGLQMKNLYSWMDVAKRTEVVYDQSLRSDDDDLLLRLSR
jgi:phosphatidylinositol glycan class A protein